MPVEIHNCIANKNKQKRRDNPIKENDMQRLNFLKVSFRIKLC